MTEEEFWAVLAPSIPPAPFYRLYHDDQGNPLFYSMEDAPGNYIEIDRETYLNPPAHVRVMDGKLKILSEHTPKKLVPSETGTSCSVFDVCVVVDACETHTKWALK